MTLQTTGPLPASDINNELNRPRTTTFDINAADSRRLAQTGTVNMYTPARPSTTPGTFIAYSQFYGASNEIPVQFLVVAGGGGGGGAAGVGGGGGAGGVLNFTANVIPIPGGTISVTVGAGGAGGPGGPSGIFSDGSKGSNSSVRYTNSSGTTTRTAEGGGGGGGGETTTAVNQRASSGGSGGGGGRNRYASNPGSPYLGGAGASGQGNAGGNGFGTASQDIASSGGGGGGAGGAGGAGSSNQGGRGGGGVALTIGALRFEVAGGGGGGAFGGSGATGGVPGSNPSGAAGVAGLGGGAGAGDGGAPPSFSATPFWTVEQNMNASYVTDWRMGKGGRVLATVTANTTGTFNRTGGVPNGTTYPAYITYQTEPRWGSNQLRSYAVYFDPNPKLYWYRNWNTTDATQPAPFNGYTSPAGWTATGFNITFPGTGTRTYRFLWSFDSYIFQMDIGSVTNALSGANTRFHRWTQTTDIALPAGTPQACQMRFNYGIQPLGSRGITVHIYAPTGSGGGNPGGSAVINAAMRTGYGSGGGGAGGGGLVISGGAGARGVVALAYVGNTAMSTGGTVTVTGGFVHHVFTTSGTFRWTGSTPSPTPPPPPLSTGFLITGSTTTSAVSGDGITWSTGGSLPAGFLSRIAWTGSRWVVIQSGSSTGTTAATSDDGGITWTTRTIVGGNWAGVAYDPGANRLVAVTYNQNRAAYSDDDGVTWTSTTMPAPASPETRSTWNFNDFVYGGGVFVGIGTNVSSVLTSPDGINWTQRTLPVSAIWRGLTYGMGQFVAIVQNSDIAATSPDGINWTQRTLPVNTSWHKVAYGNGTFVAVAINTNIAATSSDGITWTQRTLPSNLTWSDITYGAGLFVVVAGNGSTTALTSPDGITWTQRTIPAGGNWFTIAYGV